MSSNNILERLIPYGSQDDLSQRVSDLFSWYRIGDNVIPSRSTNPELPQGILIAFPKESFGFTYYPFDELTRLLQNLPENHPIISEILRQADKNLSEIATKSSAELRKYKPEYLNAFLVGQWEYEILFERVRTAARHVTDEIVLSEDNPPREHEIMYSAASSMYHYIGTHHDDCTAFFQALYGKRLLLPFVISGFIELKDETAIRAYFDFFAEANGNKEFVLNGIRRGIDFKFLGRRLKKHFPNYDFNININAFDNPNLRLRLQEIFS